MNEEIEKYVAFYGERHRWVIETAIKFLDDREPQWKLSKPINRDRYLQHLLIKDGEPV